MYISPKTKQQETMAKIAKLQRRLGEIREYKQLIAVDGLLPDADDKQKESELIVRLLYLEKQLATPMPTPGPGGKARGPQRMPSSRPARRR